MAREGDFETDTLWNRDGVPRPIFPCLAGETSLPLDTKVILGKKSIKNQHTHLCFALSFRRVFVSLNNCGNFNTIQKNICWLLLHARYHVRP